MLAWVFETIAVFHYFFFFPFFANYFVFDIVEEAYQEP